MNEDIILFDEREYKYECFWNLEPEKVHNIEKNVNKYNDKYGYRYRISSGTCQDVINNGRYKNWQNSQATHTNLVIEYNNDETNKELLEFWVR